MASSSTAAEHSDRTSVEATVQRLTDLTTNLTHAIEAASGSLSLRESLRLQTIENTLLPVRDEMRVYLKSMKDKSKSLSQACTLAQQSEADWLQQKDKQTQEVKKLEQSTKVLQDREEKLHAAQFDFNFRTETIMKEIRCISTIVETQAVELKTKAARLDSRAVELSLRAAELEARATELDVRAVEQIQDSMAFRYGAKALDERERQISIAEQELGTRKDVLGLEIASKTASMNE